MEIMLDKKQIQAIFLFKFKMGHKQWRQLATSTMHLAQEVLLNGQWSGGSGSFAKEMRGLEMKSVVAGYRKLMTTNREHHHSWCSYNYMRSCPQTQCRSFYGWLLFEANWKGEKSWLVGASRADYKSKKSFWSGFSYSMQQQWTISKSDCNVWQKVDFIRQAATTNSVVRPRRSSKALPKAKPEPPKKQVCSMLQ